MFEKRDFLILGFIFLLAYILRVIFLPSNALTFGYDQARDAFVVREIISGDFKILGPPASTPGLYHGVLYYYYLVFPYLLGANPVYAAYWNSLFNALVVFFVYILTYLFVGKKGPSFLAALLFAISFEATQYANWLSNPTIGVVSVPLIYLGLWIWINDFKHKKDKRIYWGPFLTAIGFGISVQAEVFLLYHGIVIAFWLFVSRSKVLLREFLLFLTVFFVVLSTMILSEFKFGFRGVIGLLSLFTNGGSLKFAKSFGDILVLYLNQLGRLFSYSTYPGNVWWGAGFVFILLVYSIWTLNKKRVGWKAFLSSILLSHASVVSLGGQSTPFLLVGLAPFVSIIVAIFLHKWWARGYKTVAFFVFLIIVFGNLSMIFRENKKGQTIFAIQQDMVLSKQIPLIDYTYNEANGARFSINTLTSPLWVNTVWSYLYNFYGEPRYGYLPSWHGRDQVGRLGNNLENASSDVNLFFLILEPMEGIPKKFLDETVASEDAVSRIIESKNFGSIVVQKREALNE